MKTMVQKMFVKYQSVVNNEKGAQAIEWIALAGVVMAVFGSVIAYFDGDPTQVGTAIGDTLAAIIKKLQGEG